MNPITDTDPFFSIGGGAYVRDKAEGVAKAIFLEKQNLFGFNLFSITIEDKSILIPSHEPNPQRVIWSGSLFFTFEKVQSTYLKITEEDNQGYTSVLFVDLNTSSNCIAYRTIPQEITEKDALKKIEGLLYCKPACLLFNGYGTALLLLKKEYYEVYFAHPDEEKVRKIDLSRLYSKPFLEVDFSSEDGFIHIEKRDGGKVTINNKPANILFL